MLDCIESEWHRLELHRLASILSDEEFLQHLNIADSTDKEEMKELFRSSSLRDDHDSLLDRPFRSRHQLWRRRHQHRVPSSRYSDGTFPVFYASLEAQTSEEEQKYWFRQLSTVSPHPVLFYQRFKCDFEGSIKDLRPRQDEWPELTHSTDYTFCNRLGLAAGQSGLDALMVPSARRPGGTNVPVFARRALSNARQLETVSLSLDPVTGTVAATPVRP